MFFEKFYWRCISPCFLKLRDVAMHRGRTAGTVLGTYSTSRDRAARAAARAR
eukprot:SAG31_NODE_13460_length_867_cov_1.500000_1_plen_51_part_01